MFTPVSDEILNSEETLTREELNILAKSVVECSEILDICTDRDRDVIEYHNRYLAKVIERLERSLDFKKTSGKSGNA